ncbi:hypothetical protein [Deinococcus arenicola]|uniref:Uncharacterized protein n=1 Tax=Deinococcus arenicola TaxID=2994950 RepID=A0ABU4DMU7_9DEIO|nr:hypothetical protein [Deinococcus sp. ZS9-10]MDV6373758.1 hypothetical protein [Deinococcus sp. ZS9-10]
MTTREEAKAKLETLSDASFEEVVQLIERKAQIERHLAALSAFQEGWTPEEQAAWDEGTKRRPWRTVEPESPE